MSKFKESKGVTLFELPSLILTNICSFLDVKDLVAVYHVNAFTQVFVKNESAIWKAIAIKKKFSIEIFTMNNVIAYYRFQKKTFLIRVSKIVETYNNGSSVLETKIRGHLQITCAYDGLVFKSYNYF